MGDSYSTYSVYSGFLTLPVELRCQIYGHVLAESQAITISAGYISVFGNRIQDRRRKTEIPGLPLALTPLVRSYHDPSLLSVANPPTLPIDNGWMRDIETDKTVYPGPMALALTCRLVNDEMTDYVRGQKRIAQAQSTTGDSRSEDRGEGREGLSLYVTYPYGVLVLKHLYPFLLKQAKRVHISGHYTATQDSEPEPAQATAPEASESFNDHLTPSNSFVAAESFGTPAPAHRLNPSLKRPAHSTALTQPNTRPRLRLDPLPSRTDAHVSTITCSFPPFPQPTGVLAPAALAHLVRTILPDTPTRLTKLTARILYPGENSYTAVWSDDNSPICHVLRSICGGKIDMQVKRGGLATGVSLTARPKPESRIVSTSWENWRAGEQRGARGAGRLQRRGRLDGGDLDTFLTGEV